MIFLFIALFPLMKLETAYIYIYTKLVSAHRGTVS